MKLHIGVLCLTAQVLAAEPGLGSIVRIDSGWIAGSGTTVRSYKGIPYAAAPTGDLRWKPPQAPKPWKGMLMAKSYPSMCPQLPLITGPQSEDCLGLNVWTPAASAAAKLPVMVWIPGGGFQIGASSQRVYDGDPMAGQDLGGVTRDERRCVFGLPAR